MSVMVMPSGRLTGYYLETMEAQYRSMPLGKATMEPGSAFTILKGTCTFDRYINTADPFSLLCRSHSVAILRPEMKEIMNELDAIKFDYRLANTGGVYHDRPVKRLRNWKRYRSHLPAAKSLYTTNAWYEDELPILCEMILLAFKRALFNLDRIEAQPDLSWMGKGKTVGTGYSRALGTREGFGLNLKYHKTEIERIMTDYTNDLLQALLGYEMPKPGDIPGKARESLIPTLKERERAWPRVGVRIDLTGSKYEGITAGRRSAADMVGAQLSDQLIKQKSYLIWLNVIEASAREVGNDPLSVAHSPGLNPRWYRRAVIKKYQTPIELDITDPLSHIAMWSTPPVTMVDDNEAGVVAVDFGYRWPPARLIKQGGQWQWAQEQERVKLGADQVSMQDIFIFTLAQRIIAMIKSGSPITWIHYKAMIMRRIYTICREHGLTSIRVLQTGDDLGIKGLPGEIAILFDILGSWLRIKGWTHNGGFLQARMCIWPKDKELVYIFVPPRNQKTMASAKADTTGKSAQLQVGETAALDISEEARVSMDTFWKHFKPMGFYKGSRDEVKDTLQPIFWEAMKLLVRAGHSDWMPEVFGVGP